MPFGFKRDTTKDIDYKTRLERKLCVAREDPEPIFDLSECNLKTVPSGIYSLCKVFRKEALYLHNNILTSLNGGGSLQDLALLTVLDVHCNKLSQLPSNIADLRNLERLDISDNLLRELPSSLSQLPRLLHLQAASNALSRLPASLPQCPALQTLDLRDNKPLRRLPVELGALHGLESVLVNGGVVYPPPEVWEGGGRAVSKFLAAECGVVAVSGESTRQTMDTENTEREETNPLQERLKLLEKAKEERRQERLNLEQNLNNATQQELQSHQANQDRRRQLVGQLHGEKHILEQKLVRLQRMREEKRAALLHQCCSEEQSANVMVEQLLNSSRTQRDRAAWQAEQDRRLEDKLLMLLRQTDKHLDTKRVLESMKQLMSEELDRSERLKKYQKQRNEATQSLVADENVWSKRLQEAMKRSGSDQRALLDSIQRDEELQRAAVERLMERSDVRCLEIQRRVGLVTQQLNRLTQMELRKRREDNKHAMVELSKERVELGLLLEQLLTEQSLRRLQLASSLQNRSASDWLPRFQALLDTSRVVQSLQNLQPALLDEFLLANVFCYLPLLSEVLQDDAALAAVDNKYLLKVGVTVPDDQHLVLKAISAYLTSKQSVRPAPPLLPLPSAPEEFTASAPLLSPTASSFTPHPRQEECVVCLDAPCDVVLMPCGHTCCCATCATSLAACPLCRSTVERMHQLLL